MQIITPTTMRQTGRNLAQATNLPEIFYTVDMDFGTSESYQINFTEINQTKQFGIVETIFIDNGSNPSEVEVTVSGTDQFFTVPSYAQGYFPISAAAQSVLTLTSDGGATDIVTVAFYNYKIAGLVWYQYGSTNNNTPIKTYGPMTPGDTIAGEQFNTPVYIGGIDGGGEFRGLLVDTNGRIEIAGTVSLSGSIIIDDGDDAAEGATTDAAVTNPTSAGSMIALTKGNLAGIGSTTDAAVVGGNNGSIISQVKGLNLALGFQASGVITNPATDAPIISYIRGILTAEGQVTDAAVTNPASSASLIANGKGQLTALGSVADASVTNPASSASIIAILKGLMQYAINASGSDANLISYTGTITTVAAAAANTLLLTVDGTRRGTTIFNESASATLYLSLGTAAASLTSYTVQIAPNGYYEVPFGYYGEIRGIWSAAVGNARITALS